MHTYMDGAMVGFGGATVPPPQFKKKKNILLYIWVLILAILFYKITFFPP